MKDARLRVQRDETGFPRQVEHDEDEKKEDDDDDDDGDDYVPVVVPVVVPDVGRRDTDRC